jgi:hypothetical protein
MNTEDFVRSVLGYLHPVVITIGTENWHGWVSPDPQEDWDIISTHSKLFYERNIRLFKCFCPELGCHAVWTIPNLEVWKIPEYIGFGGIYEPDLPRQAKIILTDIFEQCPFEIAWIDPIALEGRFMDDLTDEQAQVIEDIIEEFAGGSNGVLIDQWIQDLENQTGEPLGERLAEAHLKLLDKQIDHLPPDLPEVPAIWELIQDNRSFRISFDPW